MNVAAVARSCSPVIPDPHLPRLAISISTTGRDVHLHVGLLREGAADKIKERLFWTTRLIILCPHSVLAGLSMGRLHLSLAMILFAPLLVNANDDASNATYMDIFTASGVVPDVIPSFTGTAIQLEFPGLSNKVPVGTGLSVERGCPNVSTES